MPADEWMVAALTQRADLLRTRRGRPRPAGGTLPWMFVLVITGPPGAGKTSVLTALVDALSDDDIPHAALEVEMAVWTHPALSDEQWSHHVQTLCELSRDDGFELLL